MDDSARRLSLVQCVRVELPHRFLQKGPAALKDEDRWVVCPGFPGFGSKASVQ